MGRLRFVVRIPVAVSSLFLLLLLPACGGHKPAGTSPFPAKITLNPGNSVSLQSGAALVFTASAVNGLNAALNPTFTFSSDNPSVVDISPAGLACAGSWNAPYYNICTAARAGTANVTATALGATSPPTLVYVHPPIDNVQISVVQPVNAPPPACPAQTALPAACDIKFNNEAHNYCLSQNQVVTLQAQAFSQGVDVTAEVGPFTWNQNNLNVVRITPIVTTANNYPTNQVTVVSDNPGQTEVVATISGVSSQPYSTETCPVQCISMQLGANGTGDLGATSFVTNKGTSQTITATAVDVQGCVVPTPTLTWTSSAPAAIAAGSGTAGCGTTSSCTLSTTQPGAAAITASCTPPTCNIGFPIAPTNVPALYVPQPVYPAFSISGLVTGAASASSVLATSQDCYSSVLCQAALYDISTTSTVVGGATPIPTPPNSLMFDSLGDKAYIGSEYGAQLLTVANLGSSSASPFTALGASSTTLGRVTGKIIAVSPNGSLAIFSDTVSTPNQVYVVNTGSAAGLTVAQNINSATGATFSPDNSKAFILANGGNTLYVFSTLQALQTLPTLTAPADGVVFSSSGSFALLSGGTLPATGLVAYNTCDNSQVLLNYPSGAVPLPATPLFLKMVPAGSAPTGNSLIPALTPQGLDVFIGVDNTGIDVIATTTTTSTLAPTQLCPQQTITFATEVANPAVQFTPLHINLGKGTFHPINFFVSPDGSRVFIVTSDLGILVYDFSTQTIGAIQLIGNASPISADMTVDGTLIYVAGSDDQLHQIVTSEEIDQTPPITFPQLVNSSNNFCYQNYTCNLNIVAVKP